MKKSFLAFAAASLLLTTACSNQDELLQDNQGNGQTINLTLEATRGGDAQATRTAITYNSEYASLESVWSAGDVIYVYSRRSGEQIGTLTQTGTIINQKASSTSQYPTSYATFSGSVTLGSGDALTDDYAFVYQGSGRSLTPTDGKLTYAMGTSDDVAGLSAWDLAYTTGKIQGTAASASCAVSFTNKMAFGYFTTAGLSGTLNAQYYSSFTFDVKTGTLTGQSGTVTIPSGQAFYMPLIPGTVNMDCGKTWSQQGDKWGYGTTKQSKSFTASAGYYYRLGRNASDPFGPVAFESTDWTLYETLKNSKFSVSASKEVYFTQGNLQYIGSAATPYWRIAPDQYSYLGSANGKPSSTDSGSKIAADTDVDLFGWGEVTPPFLGSTVNADYQPDITAGNLTTDWATKFENGTTLYAEAGKVYPKNGTTYCCLTKDEWKYLFANQYWGFATVNLTGGGTKKGLVICPNTVTTEEAAKVFLTGTVYKSSTTQTGKTSAYSENTIDQATIDNNGLLFLPAAGFRNGLSMQTVSTDGYYCTTTTSGSSGLAYFVRFGTVYYISNPGFNSAANSNRYYGFSVRLACLAN